MGGMIQVSVEGDYTNLKRFLQKDFVGDLRSTLESQARLGQAALAAATPVETGLTAASWGYEVETNRGGATITWTNTNIHNGVPIAIILQYGHGTGTGGYVAGRDYINPAIKPVMDSISTKVGEALKR